MSEVVRVALLGLASTGKSTYLGALWALIDEPQFTSLKEVDVRGDRTYVQALAAAVVAAEPLVRTETDSDKGLEVEVEFAGDGAVSLSLADRSGEQLRELVEERHWRPLLDAEVEKLDAVMLFLHPAEIELPLPLRVATAAWATPNRAPSIDAGAGAAEGETLPGQGVEADSSRTAPDLSARPAEQATATADAEGSSAPADHSEETRATAEPPTFTNKAAATAAKLVDGLENLLERTRDRWPLPIAVVVSAFDLAGDRTPEEWLAARLPALVAFLENNPDRVEWTGFGVSAQGGALPDAREELLGKGDIQDRCFARRADGTPVPLSEPIRWAVGWR